VAQLLVGGGFAYFASQGFPTFGAGSIEARLAAAVIPQTPRARVDHFDAKRAFALLRSQVAIGPRPAGSARLRALAEQLRARLPNGRFENIPQHPGLRNVVGTVPGRAPAIVIGAHYDSQPDPVGFVGANDSAAGTAALVELARAFARQPRPKGARQLRFVLFDGEELPPGVPDTGDEFLARALRGSKAYAAAHRGQTARMILLDYIANRGVRFPREQSSDSAVWARMRSAAQRVGVGAAFPNAVEEGIIDDHIPFLEQRVPAIDLIDWSYTDKNTLRDTLDKVTVADLDVTGEAVYELIRSERLR
jgi:hypothetical protein